MGIALLAVVVIAIALGAGAAAKGGGLPQFGEDRHDYKGFAVYVGQSPDANAPAPWRWRVADGKGEPVANLFGWAKTEPEALGAGQKAVDDLVAGHIENPVPAPTPPGPQGQGAPVPPGPSPAQIQPNAACEMLVGDGPYSICVYRTNTTWAYRATDGAGMPVATAGGFATKLDAKIGGWAVLAPFPVSVPSSTRYGARLRSNGVVDLVDQAAYLPRAQAVLAGELNRGETDPRGLVLAVLGSFWPSVNPFRFRPGDHSLAQAADELARAGTLAEKALAVFAPFTAGASQGA